MKTIVVAIDFSDATQRVVAMGTTLAKALGAPPPERAEHDGGDYQGSRA